MSDSTQQEQKLSQEDLAALVQYFELLLEIEQSIKQRQERPTDG